MAFRVNGDFKDNSLSFSVSDTITKKDLEEFYTDLRFQVCDLKPDFDVIGDFSQCNLIYLNSKGTLKSIMRYLVSKRIREKVRVVSDNLFSRQLKTITEEQRIYEPTYVSSLEEAREHLNRPLRRNGLRIYLHEKMARFLVTGQERQGRVICMSTSGCSMEQESMQPLSGEQGILSIHLKSSESSWQYFKIPAEIVKADNDSLNMKFLDLDEDQKNALWSCLLTEVDLRPH